MFPAPLPVPTNSSPVLKDPTLTALPFSSQPGVWPLSGLCLCVCVCLPAVVLWLLIREFHCSCELCVCSLSWEGLGHVAILALCPPVTSISSCSLQSALPLRSPIPSLDLGLRENCAQGRSPGVYPLCFLSEKTYSRLHQFRRSVSCWRGHRPPGVLILLGCPLQSSSLSYRLQKGTSGEFQVQGFLPLGNELLTYLLSNNPADSGILPSPTFSASGTFSSSPVHLTRGFLSSLKRVSGRDG